MVKIVLGMEKTLLRKHISLDPAGIATHKHVIGVTGQGKSKLHASTFVQLLHQGIAASLIDPHSDLAADVLSFLADSGYLDGPN